MELENGIVFHGEFPPGIRSESKESANGDPLWNSLKQGSAAAFETVFRQYYPVLLNYGLKLNPDEEEVKDCIQILFLNIWERRSFLGPSDSIRNYLLASLRRLIIKRLKSAPSFVEWDEDNSLFHIELSIESRMIHDQTLDHNENCLQSAIHRLPDRQKEALYLKFYGNQSFADIATVMNISTRAVYKLIYKALDSLNEDLGLRDKEVSFFVGSALSLALSAVGFVAGRFFAFSSLFESM